MKSGLSSALVRRFYGLAMYWGAVRVVCCLSAIWLGSTTLGIAQTTPDPAEPTADSSRLHAQRTQLAERIGKLAALAASIQSTEGQPATVAASAELKLLRSLDLIYLSHQTVSEQTTEAVAERDRLQEELRLLQASQDSAARACSWLLLDDYRDSLDGEVIRGASRATELAESQSAVESALQEQDRVERNRRRVLEDVAVAAEAGTTADGEYRVRLADLEATIARATVDLRRAELGWKKAEYEAAEKRRTLLEVRIERMRPRAVFSQEELQSRQQALQAYAVELQSRLAEAQQRWRQVNAAAAETGPPDTVKAAADPGPNNGGSLSPDSASNPASWSDDTRRLIRRICHEEVNEIERRAVEFQSANEIVTNRFKLANRTAGSDERVNWRMEVQETLENLQAEGERLALRTGDLVQDLATLHRQARVETKAIGSLSHADIAVRTEHMERLLRTIEFCLRHVKMVQRSCGRFLEDLEQDSSDPASGPWTAKVQAIAAAAWSYELIAVGDRPITVAKVTKGLGGILAGLVAAAILSRLLGRRLLPRMGVNPGASEALRSLSFYSMCLLFAVLALQVAQVPLTAFTFLGGAAAIGIGFGSQNILNNFISGLILLVEQPICVGDLIEMQGEFGTVQQIGARSTILRTGSSIEIVIPNSKLLECNVTNLTKSDRLFRTVIKVGVAYGANVADVKRELLIAAGTHPKVLSSPAPQVLFADFGDNALHFELLFWVQIATITERRIVESDLRELIDTAFRMANIDIAFPQRDIHLDTRVPLEIRMLRHRSMTNDSVSLRKAG